MDEPRETKRPSSGFTSERRICTTARFDDTEVPGLPSTIGYISLQGRSPEQLAELVCRKLVEGGTELSGLQARMSDSSSVASARSATSTSTRLEVSDDASHPIVGAHVLLVAANGTYQEGRTDAQGQTRITVLKRRLLTVFCAHEGFPAHVERGFDPMEDLEITLPKVEGKGSGTGYVPGLEGRLNPIRDTSDRLYLYADNIAIEGGQPQPVRFELGKLFEAEDSNGRVFDLKIVEVIGRSSLIEFAER